MTKLFDVFFCMMFTLGLRAVNSSNGFVKREQIIRQDVSFTLFASNFASVYCEI